MQKFLKSLTNIIPIIKIVTDYNNIFDIYVDSKNLLICLNILKKHQIYRFSVLSVISCIDYPEKEKRFELVYTMLSIDFPFIVNIKINVSEFENVLSSSALFQSGIWLEREIWDMFGVYFKNNLDLRRLLTDYGFPYHPLRKTFPLIGFSEIYYNYIYKKVLYKPVKLFQIKNLKKVNSTWLSLKF